MDKRKTGCSNNWKKLACLCIVILMGFCAVQMLRPNRQYTYAGDMEFPAEEAFNGLVAMDGIALPMGVYEASLEYRTDVDLGGRCTLQDGTVFTGGLLTNGEHFYSGLDRTSFRFWLFEDTEALQLVLEHEAGSSLWVGDLVITETDQLWTIFLTFLSFALFLILGSVLIQRKLRKGLLCREQRDVLFGLAVIAGMASIPFLLGTSVSGADFTYHLQRIEGVKDGLLSGQFPVRLEPEWVHGHGYADGVFYCNALLLFPAILRLLGFTVTDSYNCYGIAMNILTVGISYYCFSRIFKNRITGLMCSGLYTLSIPRIYKLVITSAVGEGSAITFFPLILYGLYRIFTEDPRSGAVLSDGHLGGSNSLADSNSLVEPKSESGISVSGYETTWIPLAFGLTGVLQTHVLSCEITAFLIIVICLLCIRKVFQKAVFWELFKAAFVAVVFSLWYIVPFLDYYLTEDMHIKHVSARTIQERGLYITQLASHFISYGTGTADLGGANSLGIGLVLVVVFFVVCILWFGGKLREKGEPILLLGKASVVFGGGLMLMSLNLFPWDWIQSWNRIVASLVSSIQFPNRFLGWAAAFLVTAFGFCLWYCQRNGERLGYVLMVVLCLAGITTSSLYLMDYVIKNQQQFQLYNEEGMGFGYISGAEYLIEGTNEETLYYKGPIAGNGVRVERYAKEYLNVEMTCANLSQEESYVELPLLHYKGYRAYVPETGEELTVQKGANNVVQVRIPATFTGTVKVGFQSPFYWRIAEFVSGTGWILMGICYLWKKRKFYGSEHGKYQKV